MTTIYMTTGLPASGKTTWAKALVEARAGQLVRVNMDEITEMLGFSRKGPVVGTPDLLEVARCLQDQAILSAVKNGKDVVLDNMHLNRKTPTRIKRLFDGDVQFIVKDFTTVPVAECVRRDKLRGEQGHRSVGEDIIRSVAKQLNKPWRLTEDFMNDIVLSEPYMPRFQAPKAILFDLDGTAAEHVARSPYDYSRVLTDGVHRHIRTLVNGYFDSGYAVFGFSGRPDINNVRKDTEEWLEENGFRYTKLYMRPADQLTVNDADVKQFLFDTYIRNNYDVEIMLDDRNRVVRRMRKLGIKVLQVQDGDF